MKHPSESQHIIYAHLVAQPLPLRDKVSLEFITERLQTGFLTLKGPSKRVLAVKGEGADTVYVFRKTKRQE